MAASDGEQRNIGAVLWDLDGTLVQTERLHAELEREILARHGVEVSAEAYMAFVGETTRAVFTRLLTQAGRQDVVEDALADKRAQAPQRIIGRALPTRGIEEVLRDVPMRTHRFALVTSAERYLAEAILERFHWGWRFEQLITADDVRHPKPDPEPYRLACERLGLPPERTLAVEDAPHGVASARGAGCRVAALPGTFDASALVAADYMLSNVGAVVGLLGVLG